ncbi:SRPBCC family protein [Flavobacterium sp. DG1-102-2]|uniref:SRPBCC family protein n=1 Tax=Flavobacterium sp. DG1-102-2 TaxID=3081663 RepID=UPI00294A88C5|nr:SRPBCC family protein [Flavobacterium sp. DG1-102-2]MDV6168778.1 SRPBCC family protein [Flavobacterium sp. DG1-102-2]
MKKTSYMTKPEKKQSNVTDLERIISVLGGAYLLYDALKKGKRSIPEIGAAGYMIYRGVSGYCFAGDVSKKLFSKPEKPKGSNINIHVRMVVDRPANEIYNFWRHLGNLPLFMEHLEGVTVLGDTLSEWKAKLPGGVGSVTWKAEIVYDEPFRYIGWTSLPGSVIKNSGKVTFKDAGELGTLVHVVFSYEAPFGAAGEEIARLINPVFEKAIRKDILAFKRYMETGTPQKLQQETVTIYS